MDMEFRRIVVPTSEYVEKREEGDMTFVCLEATEKDGMMDAIECAVLTDEMDMEEIAAKCTGWKLEQDKEAIAIAVEDKLSQITLYDKSEAVNSFLLNGESHWLDFNLRDRVFQGNERLKLMGRTDTTLWLDGMCIELPIEQAQMLIANIEAYAKDCYNVTEHHKAEVKALKTYDEVMAYDITAGYPEKIELNISETNIISL